MSEIIRRLHAAYRAARAANIDMREWRLSTTAHDELIASREANSLWGHEQKDGEAPKRTLMSVPVVIVHEGVNSWQAPPDDADGTREIPPHPITVCMSGIGKRGRWEYFDA